MRRSRSSSLLPALVLAGFALALPPAPAQPSTLTVGLGLDVEERLDGSGGPTTALGLAGTLGWRAALPADGLFTFSAAAGLDWSPDGALLLGDGEALKSRLVLRRAAHRLELGAGLAASALGTLDAGPFVRPEWSIRYQLDTGRRAVRPFLGHRGYLLREEGSEDVLAGLLEAGFTHRPSVRFGYSLGLEGGLEHWPETPLLDGTGAPLPGLRRDLTLFLTAGADGLLGYLLDWRFEAGSGIRWSNANRWLDEAALLQEESEDRWSAIGRASLAWSPSRRFSLQAGLSVLADLYMERRTLDASGAPGPENLRVVTLRPELGLDWTGNDRVYLRLSLGGDFDLSNDPAESGWELSARGGVELLLPR